MPLPWVLFLIALLAVTTISVKWDDIQMALKGKRLAVLGARGGKTHLVKFLTTGSIPAEYKQTVAPEKAPRDGFS